MAYELSNGHAVTRSAILATAWLLVSIPGSRLSR